MGEFSHVSAASNLLISIPGVTLHYYDGVNFSLFLCLQGFGRGRPQHGGCGQDPVGLLESSEPDSSTCFAGSCYSGAGSSY